RRLTPKECGKLQGFPDYWCDDLGIENPTDEDVSFWREVFDKDAEIKGLKKKKTDKQILKWLKNPHTDSAEYKMWGNGIALPCAIYIFKSLVNTANKT
ncbi:MAG: DNA (cytosine-5-)-methyltransferase, partial [Finegoldia magna]|nr:DNA (cytosine-5-)-methyltransferase [Finegoldia magna]